MDQIRNAFPGTEREMVVFPKSEHAGDSLPPPLTLRAGVHTTVNALGSQGILCEAASDGPWRFRVSIGEEFWLLRKLGLSAAFTTNPVIVSFGVILAWRGAAVSAGFVDHPVLGWSKGLAIDWAGK